MNNENLKPQAHVLTVEEQSKGGKKSVKARREKKTLREMVELINSLPAGEKDKAKLEERGIKGKNATNQAVYLSAMLSHAIKGNGTAMRLWAELSDEILGKTDGLQGVSVTLQVSDMSGGDDDTTS